MAWLMKLIFENEIGKRPAVRRQSFLRIFHKLGLGLCHCPDVLAEAGRKGEP